jgi:small subunit ribosomal protein S16
MPVKIRLSRHGKKGYPFYHIVVADSRAPRDGRYIERLGMYNPNTNPATIEFDFDRALDWLHKGAQPTDTCRTLLSKKGVLMKKHLDEGVKKGAFSAEVSQQKFEAWLNEKDAKLLALKDQVAQGKDADKKKRLEAEAKVKETRAQAIAKKLAAEATAEQTTEGPVVEQPVEKLISKKHAKEPVAEKHVKEPVAEKPAEEVVAEKIVEEPVAEKPVTEEAIVEQPVAEEHVEKPVSKKHAKEPVAEQPVTEEPAEKPVSKKHAKEPKESVAKEPVEQSIEQPLEKPAESDEAPAAAE